MKLTENDLIELSQIYNTAGRPAMTKILKEKYQVKNTYNTLKRMAKRNLIKFETKPEETISADSVFMSIDELCAPVVKKHERPDETTVNSKSKAMESMIQELIQDRLLELSRYITLSTSDRLVIVDKTTLLADGYQIIIH